MTAPYTTRSSELWSGLSFNVTVEIPKGKKGKYEVDPEGGRIRLDRNPLHVDEQPS
jgi:inorganic pyrophosphatase